MSDATRGLGELWDRAVLLAERLEPADLRRPAPDPGPDVGALLAHLAGTPRRTPAALLAALRAARERHGEGLTGPRADRLLGARCLDLYVHTHDLAVALGDPVDLHDGSAGARAAYEYLLGLTPQLAACGGDALVRVGAPAAEPAAVAVTAGRGRWVPAADGVRDSVTATPAAYVLLLSGRADPVRCRDQDALAWTGAAGAAFTERVRLG